MEIKPMYTPTLWHRGNLMDALSYETKDATFIVKAVNMHEELVDALRSLTKEVNLSKLHIRKDFSLIAAHAFALKALAKAEGK